MTKSRQIAAAAITLALGTSPLAAAAAAPAAASTAPANHTTVVLPPLDVKGGITIPPEMLDALQKLTDDDYKTREQAVAKLQEVMTRQFQQMVVLQNLMLRVQDGLADQLRQMTQGQEAEGQVRVAGLMEFNSAVSRWAIDVMALPEKQREDLLKWGMKDENLPLVARAYSRSEDVRAKAAKELAKLTSEESDWLLVQLLNDPTRDVSLHALDAVYDRKPTEPVVGAIWDRVLNAAMSQYRSRPTRQKIITIHGRTIQIYDQDYAAAARMQDADVAADILIHYKDPAVTRRLNDLFVELAGSMANQNDYRWRIISPNYGEGGKAISRIIEAYKPREVVPFLLKVLSLNNNDGSDTTQNNEKLRYSTRIDAAALLIRITGQDPQDYKLKKFANWGDRWMLKGAMPEEEALVKSVEKWWKEHGKEWEAKEGAGSAATRPQGG